MIGCAEPVANDDLVLAAFAEVRKPPPDELLGVSSEVVLIERSRSALALLPGGSRTDGSQSGGR